MSQAPGTMLKAHPSRSEKKRIAIVLQPAHVQCRRIMRGIAAVSAEARWECLIVSEDRLGQLRTLPLGFFDGIIGLLSDPDVMVEIARLKLPAVDISSAPITPQGAFVTTDEVAVGRLAAAHLLSLGLSHFAFVGGAAEHVCLLRQKGFVETLKTAGMDCHVRLDPLRDARVPPGSKPADQPLERVIQSWPKPIGVLGATDGIALELLVRCRKLDIKVPEAVSLIGVGNDDALCALSSPPLSSVALATSRVGYEAGRMLETLMSGQEVLDRKIFVVPAGVIPRQSTDRPGLLDAGIAAAVMYIELHAKDHLRVDDVVRELSISRRSLEQRFVKSLGRTPGAEIRRAQIELAKRVLFETDENMANVARAAGFSDAKQLGASFVRESGTTPSAYRRSSRTPPSLQPA